MKRRAYRDCIKRKGDKIEMVYDAENTPSANHTFPNCYLGEVTPGNKNCVIGTGSVLCFIRASVDALCRDDPSEISRDTRTKCLQTRRESLARPSKHTNNNF